MKFSISEARKSVDTLEHLSTLLVFVNTLGVNTLAGLLYKNKMKIKRTNSGIRFAIDSIIPNMESLSKAALKMRRFTVTIELIRYF